MRRWDGGWDYGWWAAVWLGNGILMKLSVVEDLHSYCQHLATVWRTNNIWHRSARLMDMDKEHMAHASGTALHTVL